MEEEILIKACCENNKKAQNYLSSEYSLKMFRLCYRYFKNQEEAEEDMINGFYKTFTSIKKFDFRGKGSLEKWIKTIMINEALMKIRSQKKVQFVEIKQDTFNIAEEEIDFSMDAEQIYQSITKMPAGYRTIFNLYVVDGFTHDEIAKKLEISVNTSKSQLSRARAYLKTELSKEKLEVRH